MNKYFTFVENLQKGDWGTKPPAAASDNPYRAYVESIRAGVKGAKSAPAVSGTVPVVESDAKVMVFAPHPDDESIIGLLPLRLMREAGKQIIVAPVTFGSNVERQAGRAKELADACAYLGWEVRRGKAELGALEVDDIVALLKEAQPAVVVMPHAGDWNSRHISTHFLVEEALGKMEASFACSVVETEFWGAMDDPNLMVEGDAELVSDLVAAISLHVEEVARNPYHLLLPAWMQDNVRRGGELVGGQGGAVPDFSFATLYRLRKWENGGYVQCLETGTVVPVGADKLKELF
jgi:LmbE family N-acetylglucosaminyl deacetylase